MKITSAPVSFPDAPAGGFGPAKGGADYGSQFDSAIRSAADDASKHAAPPKAEREPAKGGEAGGPKPSHDPAKATGKPGDAHAPAAGASDDAPANDGSASGEGDGSATTALLEQLVAGAEAAGLAGTPPSPGEPSSTGDPAGGAGEPARTLERLLGGRGTAEAAALAAQGRSATLAADGAAETRLPSIAVDGAAMSAADKAGAAAGSKVTLEVLHMETHFEPRSDAFVLVEGKTVPANGAAKPARSTSGVSGTAAAGEGKDAGPRLSFDEAVQRLGIVGTDGRDGDGRSERRGLRDDGGARGLAKGRTDAARTAALGLEGRSGAVASSENGLGDEADPSPFPSMTSQVAGRVIDALASDGPFKGQADLPPGDTHLRMKAGGAALKTLSIQLQPENLGRLDVSMRLVDGQLTLELAASEADTARVLAADRGSLRKLLEHAGFSMDDASISIVTRDGSLPQPLGKAQAGADAPPQDGRSSASAGGGGSGGGDARQSAGSGRDGGAERRQAPSEEGSSRSASKASAVYL